NVLKRYEVNGRRARLYSIESASRAPDRNNWYGVCAQQPLLKVNLGTGEAMRNLVQTAFQPTYVNPVYWPVYRPVHPRSCPDPFALKYLNEYWLYCTGFSNDGRCFGVLHSRDLISWRELGGAMEPLDKDATCYWAPEVWYENGIFL